MPTHPRDICDINCAYNHYCAITQIDLNEFDECLKRTALTSEARNCYQCSTSRLILLVMSLLFRVVSDIMRLGTWSTRNSIVWFSVKWLTIDRIFIVNSRDTGMTLLVNVYIFIVNKRSTSVFSCFNYSNWVKYIDRRSKHFQIIELR